MAIPRTRNKSADDILDLIVIDSDKRLVRGWANVNAKDIESDNITAEAMAQGFMDYMDIIGGMMMFKHMNRPVAKVLQWNVETHPRAGKLGIRFIARFFDQNKFHHALWEGILKGLIKGFSIGADVPDPEINQYEENGQTIVTKVEMNELSAVFDPANPYATLDQMAILAKSSDATDIQDLIDFLEIIKSAEVQEPSPDVQRLMDVYGDERGKQILELLGEEDAMKLIKAKDRVDSMPGKETPDGDDIVETEEITKAKGPGGHTPDGTGPYGRGEGPGEGKGDGSGLESKEKERVYLKAGQEPPKGITAKTGKKGGRYYDRLLGDARPPAKGTPAKADPKAEYMAQHPELSPENLKRQWGPAPGEKPEAGGEKPEKTWDDEAINATVDTWIESKEGVEGADKMVAQARQKGQISDDVAGKMYQAIASRGEAPKAAVPEAAPTGKPMDDRAQEQIDDVIRWGGDTYGLGERLIRAYGYDKKQVEEYIKKAESGAGGKDSGQHQGAMQPEAPETPTQKAEQKYTQTAQQLGLYHPDTVKAQADLVSRVIKQYPQLGRYASKIDYTNPKHLARAISEFSKVPGNEEMVAVLGQMKDLFEDPDDGEGILESMIPGYGKPETTPAEAGEAEAELENMDYAGLEEHRGVVMSQMENAGMSGDMDAMDRLGERFIKINKLMRSKIGEGDMGKNKSLNKAGNQMNPIVNVSRCVNAFAEDDVAGLKTSLNDLRGVLSLDQEGLEMHKDMMYYIVEGDLESAKQIWGKFKAIYCPETGILAAVTLTKMRTVRKAAELKEHAKTIEVKVKELKKAKAIQGLNDVTARLQKGIEMKKGCGGEPVGAQGGPQDGSGPGAKKKAVKKLQDLTKSIESINKSMSSK